MIRVEAINADLVDVSAQREFDSPDEAGEFIIEVIEEAAKVGGTIELKVYT